jgi:hypothetical protein
MRLALILPPFLLATDYCLLFMIHPDPPTFSARVGIGYRAAGVVKDDTIILRGENECLGLRVGAHVKATKRSRIRAIHFVGAAAARTHLARRIRSGKSF